MKIYLASYFQPQYHGPGRKIGISPTKPNNVNDVDFVYPQLSPLPEVNYNYHVNKKIDQKSAGEEFVKSYTEQLSKFVSDLEEDAEIENCKPINLLPFKDGDTLLSWEHAGNLSYRSILAEFLEKLGYEVIIK